VKRTVYRELDHAFGQLMLTLRTAIGQTQADLAVTLGVTRHAVGGWEAGRSYPKAQHLKGLIALGLRRRAFPAGQEREAIRALWQAAHQKSLLDERWLDDLLAAPAPSSGPAPADPGSATVHGAAGAPGTSVDPQVDWGGALDVPTFYGRDEELARLSRWLVDERCRVVSVLGMGGIGKSALAVTAMRRVAPRFEVVIWRSLRDEPSCEQLLDSCLQLLAPHATTDMPESLDGRLQLLMERLRERRVLLVLDNLEAILEHGDGAGRIYAGFHGYARLLRLVAETAHQSCLMLTSREKLADLAPLEGSRAPVRTLRLTGLDASAGELLLMEKGIVSSGQEHARLVELYQGNPLALKIVAQTIVDIFGGAAGPFLAQGEVIFGEVRDLLHQQFQRLSVLELHVVSWLAILREPVRLEELLAVFRAPHGPPPILEALDRLGRRSLIERGQQPGSFTLQAVVLEHATAQLLATAGAEIEAGRLDQLIEYGLTHAQTKEYIRRAQEQLLVRPLLQLLGRRYPAPADLEARLCALLAQLRGRDQLAQGYGPANLVALLRLLRGDLRGLDLSRLALRGAFLRDVPMQDVNLTGAVLQGCTLTEAFDDILALAVSPTGAHWAAVSRRGEIRVWEGEGRTLRHLWQAHTTMLWQHLAFSPDGHTLVCGSQSSGGARAWDVRSGELRWSRQLAASITSLAFAPDGVLASVGIDAAVRLWDPRDGSALAELPHPAPLWSLAWTKDGRLLASGDVTGTIHLWELRPGAPASLVRTLAGHTHWVMSLAFAPADDQLASASFDGTVRLWDVPAGSCLHIFSGHTERALRVTWSPDGRTLASCSFDRTIRLWDVAARQLQAVLRGHTAVVTGVSFLPSSQTVVSGSDDGTIRVWDVGSRECVQIIGGHVTSVLDLDWSPDGAQIAAGGADTLVTLWDVAKGAVRHALRGHRWVVHGVVWQPGGTLLASTGLDNHMLLWDAAAGTRLRELYDSDGLDTIFRGLAWSPDGRLLACGGFVRGVQVWDAATFTRRWAAQTPSALIRRVAWRPDGAQLAAVDTDGVISLWDADDGGLLLRLVGHSGAVMSIAWSPDGRRIATGSDGGAGGELLVWDTQTGERVQAILGHEGLVAALAWSASGEQLVSGGPDGMLRWWHVESGAGLRAQEAHQGAVHALKRGPDGRLASCGNDGAIVLWDAITGERLQTLRRDRPYERMQIAGLAGVSDLQRAELIALGAVERAPETAVIAPAAPVGAPQPPAPARRAGGGLPSQPTALVGREDELSAIAVMLAEPSCRLLTLLGPGGVGKTRLAIAVAEAHASAYADGARFVDLSAVETVDQLVFALGAALSIVFTGHGEATAELLRQLRERQLLLVLDNVEHVIAGAGLVAQIVEMAPAVRVLVTSRERLNLRAEWLFDVEGLSYPPELPLEAGGTQRQPDLAGYSAVQLFLQRARQVRPRLAPTEQELVAVGRICGLVAGVPLAVELAAAAVRTLTLAEIERQLRANLDVIVEGPRDLPPRHRSLRATFDYSWRLLGRMEQTLWSQLAVFRGGWTPEAAEQVVGATPSALQGLVDRSLVREIDEEESGARFTMLEPIREYALERLAVHPDAALVRRRHVRYFVTIAGSGQARLLGPEQAAWLNRLGSEHDNLRAALDWSLAEREAELGLGLGSALAGFWRIRGHLTEGRRRLDALLAAFAGPPVPRLQVLLGAIMLAGEQDDNARSRQLAEELMAGARALGERRWLGEAHAVLGKIALSQGQAPEALARFEEALALFRAAGEVRGEANVLLNLGRTLLGRGAIAEAAAYLSESKTLHRQIGDSMGLIYTLLHQGVIAVAAEDLAEIQALGREALQLAWASQFVSMLGYSIGLLAIPAILEGRLERGVRLFGAASRVFEELGIAMAPPEQARTEHWLRVAQEQLEPAIYTLAWEAGRGLPRKAAVAEALESVPGQ
jgi:WD40 repeat protein/predicted ATPase/transcriptional regulator with XRE-family HTH domain